VIPTTLVVTVFLAQMFGGTIRAERLTFDSPQLCEAFKRELAQFTFKHEIHQDCDPPVPVSPPPPEPDSPAEQAQES